MTVHRVSPEPRHADAFSAFAKKVLGVVRKPPRCPPLDKEKLTDIPEEPGIYAIYEGRDLIYVGESGCLKERVGDLFRTRNHSFRRSLGAERFNGHPGFRRATTTQSFSPAIEAALTKLCADSLSILIVPVAFGRKEIEELLVGDGGTLRNKRGRRGR